MSERIVRACARKARPRIVSYPGSRGYRLWEDCTTKDLHSCMDGFRRQRDDMDESYLIYTRAFHGGYKGGES